MKIRLEMLMAGMLVWSSPAWSQVASHMNPISPGAAEPRANTTQNKQEPLADANHLLPDLTMPSGKATLIGGTISRLDRVRDQLVIRAFGGGEMKLLFDSRTGVWSDGNKATSRDLRVGQKAYVDTLLDGTQIFAKNIRVVSRGVTGQSRGQVVAYDRSASEMTLNDGLSPESLKVKILPRTKIISKDREISTSALQSGALVEVEFRPDSDGAISAEKVSILAEPGTSFAFVGKVIFLDLHKGLLVMMDPRDKKNYEVHFNPATVRITGNLQLDSSVTVNAGFDGVNYATNVITVSPSAD